MKFKPWIAVLAAALAGVALVPAQAAKAAKKEVKESKEASSKPVIVTVAPPSGTWETTPPPAVGWLWSAGFHDWRDGRFVWQPGEWIALKPGYEYRQHKWVSAGEGRWKLTGGDWVKADDDDAVADKK